MEHQKILDLLIKLSDSKLVTKMVSKALTGMKKG